MSDVDEAPATLANWRTAPHNRWGFRNVDKLIRTEAIARGETVRPLPAGAPLDLAAIAFDGGAGPESVAGLVAASDTDGFLVLHRGRVVAETYGNGLSPETRHIVFSVSKSMTAIVAGILVGEGKLDPDAPVTAYVPEAAGSAYGDATVRHLLDMTVAVTFVEDYLDPHGDVARYRIAMDWNPPGMTAPAAGSPGLHGFVVTLPRAEGAHGARFHYVSPNADLLGLVVERAGGERFAPLMSRLVWAPLGAEHDGFVTIDRQGASRTAGGVCVTLRDLARFGEMVRNGGVVDGRRIVPAAWIDDIRTNGDRDAWVAGDSTLLPDGRYRSQWYSIGDPHGSFAAIGIHGQWIYIDPAAEMVVVKQSSQPLPVDDPLDLRLIAGFRALGDRLAG